MFLYVIFSICIFNSAVAGVLDSIIDTITPGSEKISSDTGLKNQKLVTLPGARIKVIDKVSSDSMVLDIKVGSVTEFRDIDISILRCIKSKDGFLSFVEIFQKKDSSKIFNGWIFANRPNLNGMQNKSYEVFLVECFE